MKKYIIILIVLISFSFAQKTSVPDSVIVNKIEALVVEYNSNNEIIKKNAEVNEINLAKQKFQTKKKEQ